MPGLRIKGRIAGFAVKGRPMRFSLRSLHFAVFHDFPSRTLRYTAPGATISGSPLLPLPCFRLFRQHARHKDAGGFCGVLPRDHTQDRVQKQRPENLFQHAPSLANRNHLGSVRCAVKCDDKRPRRPANLLQPAHNLSRILNDWNQCQHAILRNEHAHL